MEFSQKIQKLLPLCSDFDSFVKETVCELFCVGTLVLEFDSSSLVMTIVVVVTCGSGFGGSTNIK